MSARQKIVIIGGGPAGLAAALSLTDPMLHPDWKNKYEVTVLQMGWRVGGKGAAGRRGTAQHVDGEWRLVGDGRIEEHGIHLFGNMYVNSIRMLDGCLGELVRAPGEPVTTIETDLVPSNYIQLADYFDRSWHLTPQHLPHNDLQPWGPDVYPGPEVLVAELLQLARELLDEALGGDTTPHPGTAGRLAALERLLLHHRQNPATPNHDDHHGAIEELWASAGHLRDVFEGTPAGGGDDGASRRALLRSVWCQIEMYATVAKGVVADDIFGRGIDSVDGETFIAWCRRHGMSDAVVESSPVQMPAQMCFQFPDGDTTMAPNFSASGFLWFVLRQVLACGQATYWFKRGTADTVVAPLYRVAAQRGVQFRFFHKVRSIRTNGIDAGPDQRRISAIDIDVQATTLDDQPYEPLVRMDDGAFGWPSRPIYGQLAQGDQLQAEKIDLESWWSPWKPVATTTLRADVDFDHVISAVPLPCLPILAPDVVAVAPWRDAVDPMGGLATMAAQLWTNRTTRELGFPALPGTDRVCGGAAVPPLGFADMSDVIEAEQWDPAQPPVGLLYLCGPLSHRGPWPDFDQYDTPALAGQRAAATLSQWLRTAVTVLPAAGANPAVPESFDMDALYCPPGREPAAQTAPPPQTAQGDARLELQYCRANIDPNERYVPSPPGSAALRPKAWDSGFDNLVLASDWIFTGINIGSFEGAVMSGLLAAHAVTGTPTLDSIVGYTFARPAAVAPGSS